MPGQRLTKQEAAAMSKCSARTLQRALLDGRLVGKYENGKLWFTAQAVRAFVARRHQPTALSNRALKKIYASSSRLTANVDRAQIREMIRRGFFSKGVWLDELDTLESVAREILNSRDNQGRTMLEIDPEFWTNAKYIVDLGAKVPSEERHSKAQREEKTKTEKRFGRAASS